jgi:hypothetical protein
MALVDEYISVALRAATDLRDACCYDLMKAGITEHNTAVPRWARRRWQHANRWAVSQGLPKPWTRGRPRRPWPDDYVEIHLPD